MTAKDIVGIVIAVLLAAYLIYSLLFPEKL